MNKTTKEILISFLKKGDFFSAILFAEDNRVKEATLKKLVENYAIDCEDKKRFLGLA